MSGPLDVRPLLSPLHQELVGMLRQLAPGDWARATAAGSWTVRDVAAHLLDGMLRRLSFERDALPLLEPESPIRGYTDLVAFLDGLNAEWTRAARRLSPQVLLWLVTLAGREEAAFLASLPLEGEAFLPVAWTGRQRSPAWLDIGREYTELWHHQQQIREAVGRPLLDAPHWLGPVLRISLEALPRAYAQTDAPEGTQVLVEIEGPSGGRWGLARSGERWALVPPLERFAARLRVPEGAAWRVLLSALPPAQARVASVVEGPPALTDPFFEARAVMV